MAERRFSAVEYPGCERLKPRNQEYFFGQFISKPGEARAATPDEEKDFNDSSSDEDSDLARSNGDGYMLVSKNDTIRHDGGQKVLPEIFKMQETPVRSSKIMICFTRLSNTLSGCNTDPDWC